jgi:hypothetical protein
VRPNGRLYNGTIFPSPITTQHHGLIRRISLVLFHIAVTDSDNPEPPSMINCGVENTSQ